VLYSDPPLLRGNVEDIVAANEGVAVLVLQLPIHVLLRLLQTDIHVAIQTGQHTWNLVSGLGEIVKRDECVWELIERTSIVNAVVQLYGDGASVYLIDELRQGLFAGHFQ